MTTPPIPPTRGKSFGSKVAVQTELVAKAPTLQALSLTANQFTVGDPEGTIIGNVDGLTPSSTLFLGDSRSGAVELSGKVVKVGPSPPGAAGIFTIQLMEVLTAATNSPNLTSLSINELSLLIPVNTALPTISGIAQNGQTLTATTGTWTNNPTGFAYQWQSSGFNATGAGATTSNYTAIAADIGNALTVIVTATSGFGSGVATSSATSAVIDIAPTINTAASIPGTPQVAKPITAVDAIWNHTVTGIAYQWKAGGINGTGAGATTLTYIPTAGDIGLQLTITVTATNSGGTSAPSTSLASAAVLAGAPVGQLLYDIRIPNRTYAPDMVINPVAPVAAAGVPAGRAETEIRLPHRTYAPDILPNPVPPAVAPSSPIGASALDQPPTRRPYTAEQSFNPLPPTLPGFPVGGAVNEIRIPRRPGYAPDILDNPLLPVAARNVGSATQDQPSGRRPYIPDILLNPIAPTAIATTPVGKSTIDIRLPARPYAPDILPNAIAPAAVGAAVPVGQSTIDIRIPPRFYAPDILPNPILQLVAATQSPVGQALGETRTPVRKPYVPDILRNPILPAALTAPVGMSTDKTDVRYRRHRPYVPELPFNAVTQGSGLEIALKIDVSAIPIA